MKKLFFFLSTLTCLFISTSSFASLLETCLVKAKVISLEELSVFGEGSRSVPAGVNPDGKAVNTFVTLLNFKVLEIDEEKSGPSEICSGMLNQSLKVVLKSDNALKDVKAGDELMLQHISIYSLTPSGYAYSITWKLPE